MSKKNALGWMLHYFHDQTRDKATRHEWRLVFSFLRTKGTLPTQEIYQPPGNSPLLFPPYTVYD